MQNMDMRLGSALVFYFTFALLAAAMSTVEVSLNLEIIKFVVKKWS